jgi:hypothetical protein
VVVPPFESKALDAFVSIEVAPFGMNFIIDLLGEDYEENSAHYPNLSYTLKAGTVDLKKESDGPEYFRAFMNWSTIRENYDTLLDKFQADMIVKGTISYSTKEHGFF